MRPLHRKRVEVETLVRKGFSCLCLNGNRRNTIRRSVTERLPRHCNTLRNMVWRVQCHQAPCPLVRPRLCRCTAPDALPQSSLPRVHFLRAFQPLLGLSATASRDLVNVVHLWNLDSLLRILNLVLTCCCRQRRSDRVLLRLAGGLVLTSRRWDVLFSTVSGLATSRVHDRMRVNPLWVRSFSPTVGPLFSPAVGPLFSVLLHSGARQCCWDFSLFSSVRRALHDVHGAASWRTVRSRTFLHVLRVASWTDRHHAVSFSSAFTSLSCLGPLAEGLSVDTIVAVFCFGLWGALPSKLGRLDS